jgi:hypothetical protein
LICGLINVKIILFLKTKMLLNFSGDEIDLDNVDGQSMGSETSRKAKDQGIN